MSGDNVQTREPDRAYSSAGTSNLIGEMRALLVRLRPNCTASALKALKNAFPSSPLEARTEAYEAYASNIRRVFPHNDE